MEGQAARKHWKSAARLGVQAPHFSGREGRRELPQLRGGHRIDIEANVHRRAGEGGADTKCHLPEGAIDTHHGLVSRVGKDPSSPHLRHDRIGDHAGYDESVDLEAIQLDAHSTPGRPFVRHYLHSSHQGGPPVGPGDEGHVEAPCSGLLKDERDDIAP